MSQPFDAASHVSRVLCVTSELFPSATTRGLVDVLSALPATMSSLGADVRVMFPAYPQALDLARDTRVIQGENKLEARLLAGRTPDSDMSVTLIDAPELFSCKGGICHGDSRENWPGDGRHFASFRRASASIGPTGSGLAWCPEVVHADDWHIGWASAFLHVTAECHPKSELATHNLASEGNFLLIALSTLDPPSEALPSEGLEFYNQVSFIKAVMRYSDRLSANTLACGREILNPENGFGLVGPARAGACDLVSILNGIGYGIWDPAYDSESTRKYRADDLGGKGDWQSKLRHEMGLQRESRSPAVPYVHHLTDQKVADGALAALPQLVDTGAQIVIHDTRDRPFEEPFAHAAQARPNNLAVHLSYTAALERHTIAGCDLSLTPARYEPCGPATVYGMRRGARPITPDVASIADAVEDARSVSLAGDVGTEFLFDMAAADDLVGHRARAASWHDDSTAWNHLQPPAMMRTSTWEQSAREYLALYGFALVMTMPEDLRPIPIDPLIIPFFHREVCRLGV